MAAAPGARTPLTRPGADRAGRIALRAEVDAIAVGSGTVLVDDPLLTAREVYRERPLTRVDFRPPAAHAAGARVFSTLGAGPVIIVTTDAAVAARSERARRARGGRARSIELLPTSDLRHGASRGSARLGFMSLLLEGGAALHARPGKRASSIVSTSTSRPPALGAERRAAARRARPAPRRPSQARGREPLGADVLIEGYVHRTH